MTPKQRIRLWNAINDYAHTCGGAPYKQTSSNMGRKRAMAEVEALVFELEDNFEKRLLAVRLRLAELEEQLKNKG